MTEKNEKNISLGTDILFISLNDSKKDTIDFKVFINKYDKEYTGNDKDIGEIFEISTEEFFKSCDEKDKYSFEIIENKENSEFELNIINLKNKEQNIKIILKGDDVNISTPDNPPNILSTNKGNSGGNINNNNNDWKERLRKLKVDYYEKIKKIKEENEKLVKLNEKLKNDIDKEKKKTDENVKVYLEIRERYELAAQRNKDILLKNSQL